MPTCLSSPVAVCLYSTTQSTEHNTEHRGSAGFLLLTGNNANAATQMSVLTVFCHRAVKYKVEKISLCQ